MGLNDKQVNKNKSFWQSFGHAFDGVKSLVLTERNFRKHLVFAILAVVLGIIVRLTILFGASNEPFQKAVHYKNTVNVSFMKSQALNAN